MSAAIQQRETGILDLSSEEIQPGDSGIVEITGIPVNGTFLAIVDGPGPQRTVGVLKGEFEEDPKGRMVLKDQFQDIKIGSLISVMVTSEDVSKCLSERNFHLDLD